LAAIWVCAVGCQPDERDQALSDENSTAPLVFRLPLEVPEDFSLVVGVDHDPEEQESGWGQLNCTDYAGRAFPHCYDQHTGTDFILSGGFAAMDAGSATVVAATDGVVVDTEDGHYDRCHGDLAEGSNSCDGYSGIANHVIIEHCSGHRTLYWHLMKGSVAVEVGEEVAKGDFLGMVGSSGNSFAPHLHFGLQTPQMHTVDPFAGDFSHGSSWWCAQGEPDELPGICNGDTGGR